MGYPIVPLEYRIIAVSPLSIKCCVEILMHCPSLNSGRISYIFFPSPTPPSSPSTIIFSTQPALLAASCIIGNNDGMVATYFEFEFLNWWANSSKV